MKADLHTTRYLTVDRLGEPVLLRRLDHRDEKFMDNRCQPTLMVVDYEAGHNDYVDETAEAEARSIAPDAFTRLAPITNAMAGSPRTGARQPSYWSASLSATKAATWWTAASADWWSRSRRAWTLARVLADERCSARSKGASRPAPWKFSRDSFSFGSCRAR